jgi:hypothetical protein
MDLTAGAWIARLRGNASYGPISTEQQDVNTAYGLDTMEGAFQGDLSLMWKNWTVRATGSEFGTSATQSAVGAGAFGNTTYALGDTLSSSFDFYSWGIDVQSWVWRPLSKQQFPWEAPVANESLGGDLQVLAIVGGRGFGVNQQVQNVSTGAGSTYDNTFGTVIVGGGIDVMVDLRERLRWMDRLEFVVSGTWGPAWPGDGCTETEVMLGDGTLVQAGGVIDTRGLRDVSHFTGGWQKFVGRKFKLNSVQFKTDIRPPEPEGRVWEVKGSKGDVYKVTELRGEWSCTCSGFRFRGDCKHIKGVI